MHCVVDKRHSLTMREPANAQSVMSFTRSPAEKGSIGGVITDFSFALSFPALSP